MYEHFYELLPGEDPSEADGHLLVVLLDKGPMSDAFADYCTRRIVRLTDKAEFQMALVNAVDFPILMQRAPEIPALFHYSSGVEKSRVTGIDDCLEFFREFILNNSRQ